MTSHMQRTGAAAPTVTVESGARSAAGDAGTVGVHVRNVTTTPQSFRLTVLGLDHSWSWEPVLLADVAPDATVSADLTIIPVAGAAEGDYRFAVVVEVDGTPGRTVVDSSWQVENQGSLVISIEPAEARAARSTRVKVVVANSSTGPADVELSATAMGSGLTPQLSRRRLRLGPHESASVPLRLTADRMRLLHGSTKASYVVRAVGSHVPTEVRGVLEQRSVVTPAMAKAFGLAMALVVWIAAAGIGLPRLSEQIRGGDSQVTVKTDQSAKGGNKTDAKTDPKSGAGAADKGADKGSKKGSGSGDKADGVRISGALEGNDVSGVRVQVSPASAAAPDDASRPASGAATAALFASVGLFAGNAKSAKTWQWAVPVRQTRNDSVARSTVTGNDGTWAFSGMAATTRYLVVFSKAGYQTQRFIVSGEELSSTPLKTAMISGRGSLTGKVKGPSGVVGGATVTITDGSTTLTTRTATSGKVGTWSVGGLSTPGTYLVTAVSDELGAQTARVTLAASASKTVNLDLERGAATLAGTVSGPLLSGGGDGGLGGLTVTATDGETTRTATTATGDTSAGTFVLPALSVPGTYTVSVTGEDYLTQVQRITLRQGEATSRLTFSMNAEAGVVSGTVKDSAGAGLTAAGLKLFNDDNTYKTMSSSDGEGTFVFNGVAPGEYVLSGTLFGYEEALAQVEVSRSDDAVVALVLPALPDGGLVATSSIRGSTVDAEGGKAIDCPDLRADEECLVTVKTTMTKPDGSTADFTVTYQPNDAFQLPATPSLYPGRYTLHYTAPGYQETKVSVAVPLGATAYAATAALKQLPTLVGSVNTRVGSVPTGTCIIAIPGSGSWPEGVDCDNAVDPCKVVVSGEPIKGAFCAVVEANGSYSIKRMDPGTFRVFTKAPAGSEYVSDKLGASVTVVAGDPARRYDPILDRLGRIAVTVLNSSGSNHIEAALGAEVKAYDVRSAPGSDPAASTTSEANGYAPLSKLPAGDYRIQAKSGTGTGNRTGQLDSVGVNLNQEIAVPLVMTSQVGNLSAVVVTNPSNAGSDPVPAAKVRVTGVVGYNGLVPLRESVDLVTDDNGGFTVCTSSSACENEASVKYLGLVESQVDVTVEATSFEPYTASGVDANSLKTITLAPTAICFNAVLVFDGASTDQVSQLASAVALSVPSAPPGAGNLSISVGAVSGNRVALKWRDSKVQSSLACPNGTIRPGDYRVEAALTGFDNGRLDISLSPGGQMDTAAELVLAKFGLLRVETSVTGTVQTITLKDGTTRRVEADPGVTYIDFGALASGSYPVEVRAAGYQHETFNVSVEAGQTTAGTDVQQVVLTRLGTIRGTVTAELASDWYQAVPNALVTATMGDNQVFTATTDSEGRYAITGTVLRQGLDWGNWHVEVTAPSGYNQITDRSSTDATVAAGADTASANLVLKPQSAGFDLTVLDDASEVAAGLDVRLTYYRGSVVHMVRPVCVPGANGGVPNPNYSGTAVQDPVAACAQAGRSYLFLQELPLNYTLSVSGSGYASFVADQRLTPGETALRTVQLTAPAGAIQGTVFTQSGSVTKAAGAGVTVELVDCSLADTSACSTTTDKFGNYLFSSLPPGQYTLKASSDGLETQRVVQLGIAQSMALDLTLVKASSTVTVQVDSINGYDLTGALVTLTDGTTTFGPQPAGRGSGANSWEAVFRQVPRGDGWTAQVSGPAGHLGVHQTNEFDVDAETVQTTVAVTETQLLLKAVVGTTLPDYPVSIPVTVGTTQVTVLSNDQEKVFVKSGSVGSVTAPPTVGGWTVTGANTTIAADAVTHTATFTLTTSVAPKLVLSAPSADPVEVGDTVTFTATLTANSGPLPAMTVQLQRFVTGDWSQVASGTTDSDGKVDLDWVPTEATSSDARFRVFFPGTAPYTAATSTGEQTVKVKDKPTPPAGG